MITLTYIVSDIRTATCIAYLKPRRFKLDELDSDQILENMFKYSKGKKLTEKELLEKDRFIQLLNKSTGGLSLLEELSKEPSYLGHVIVDFEVFEFFKDDLVEPIVNIYTAEHVSLSRLLH